MKISDHYYTPKSCFAAFYINALNVLVSMVPILDRPVTAGEMYIIQSQPSVKLPDTSTGDNV